MEFLMIKLINSYLNTILTEWRVRNMLIFNEAYIIKIHPNYPSHKVFLYLSIIYEIKVNQCV